MIRENINMNIQVKTLDHLLPGQNDAKTSRADPSPDHERSMEKYQEFRL